MKQKIGTKSRPQIRFNGTKIVLYAGLKAISEMMEWLELQQLTDQRVDRTKSSATANHGSKLLTAVMSMLAGGNHIDHVNLLNAGDTGRVTDFQTKAGNTIGEWLRQFTDESLGQPRSAYLCVPGGSEAGLGSYNRSSKQPPDGRCRLHTYRCYW